MFKSSLANRLFIAKITGFIFWLIWFFILPILFPESRIITRFAILFWYTTLWGILWIFWIITEHPVFPKWRFDYWFRWIFLWAWMNFIFILFTYDYLRILIKSSIFHWQSTSWIILEWAIIWLIIEFFATKLWWEWKDLLKKTKKIKKIKKKKK